MYKKSIILSILGLGLFFINLSSFLLPYFIIVFIFIVYFILFKNKINEVVLALTIFGYIFFQIPSKQFGLTNILLLMGGLSLLLFYQIIIKWKNNKLNVLDNKLILGLYASLFLLVVFSMTNSYMLFYPNFKQNLFFLWTLIYLISINSFNKQIINFDYYFFINISFFLFLPIFSLIDIDGSSYSPLEAWSVFSITSSGLRGTGYDSIQSARISGIGVIIIIISLFNLKKDKIHQLIFLPYFLIMLIICQSRQVFLAVVFALFIKTIYSVINRKISKFNLVIILFLFVFSTIKYISYLSENNVESRVGSSFEDGENAETGRESIWEASFMAIGNGQTGVGYGNFFNVAYVHFWPHNINLELLIEVGLVSFLILLIFYIYLFNEIIKNAFKHLEELSSFLLLVTIYFIIVAQFSFDFSKNLLFLFTFFLFLTIEKLKANEN